MKDRASSAVSQGGTKSVFMIPQIVNPGSNFLVHSANEVNTGFISHFPMLQTRPTKTGLVKLTANTELASPTPRRYKSHSRGALLHSCVLRPSTSKQTARRRA